MTRALDEIQKVSSHTEFIDILQGFRQKSNKDLYQKARKVLIEKKEKFFPDDG